VSDFSSTSLFSLSRI